MKLDCVITAVNEKPLYLDFVPIFIKTWNLLYPETDVKIVLISEHIPYNLQKYKNNIILFEPIDDILTSFTSQFIRLLYPCILDYENGVMITDIDILPMNRTYYTKNIEMYDNTKFIYYRGNECFNQNQIEMCYNVATPKIWKEIFNIDSKNCIINTIKDVNNINVIKEGHGNTGWFTDQLTLYEKVLEWNKKTNNFVRLDEKYTGFNRLDRNRFDINDFNIINNIINGKYTDYHCFRPYNKYKEINERVYKYLETSEMRKNDLQDILITYGTYVKNIDITEKFTKEFINNNIVHIPKGTVFNSIFGDPVYGKIKKVCIKTPGKKNIVLNEYKSDDITIDLFNTPTYKKPKVNIVVIASRSKLYDQMIKVYWIPFISFIKEHHPNVQVYLVFGKNSVIDDLDVIKDNIIVSDTKECTFPGIFDKSVYAFKYLDKFDYDYLIRTNLSSFIMIDRLISYLDMLDSKSVYNGILLSYDNYKYVGGWNICMSKDVVSYIITNREYSNEFVLDEKDEKCYLNDDIRFGVILGDKQHTESTYDIRIQSDQYKTGKIDKLLDNNKDAYLVRIKNFVNRNKDIELLEKLTSMFYTKSNIAILVTLCSRNQLYKTINDIPLIKYLYQSFNRTKDSNYNYTFFIGFDDDDEFYINNKNKLKYITPHIYTLKGCSGAPATAWNKLAMIAYKDVVKYDYFFQIGDDVTLVTDGWTKRFVYKLVSNNNIGVVGPCHLTNYYNRVNNGTPYVIENAFVHRKHLDIFGYFFYPSIKNWYCDDWITRIYSKFFSEIQVDMVCKNNIQGSRYKIENVPLIDTYIENGVNTINNYMNKKKVFSYCIYGNKKKYCLGMIKNIEQIIEHFPEFEIWIHIGNDVNQEYIYKYKTYTNVKLFFHPFSTCRLTSYRFFSIDDPSVDVMLVRDSDSRFGKRDIWVIKDFLESSYKIFTIRDHTGHQRVIMAGQCGIKKISTLNIQTCYKDFVNKYPKSVDTWYNDQNFIEESVYDVYKNYFIAYTSKIKYIDEVTKQIQPDRVDKYDFCGNVILFDENDTEYYEFEVIKEWWIEELYNRLVHYRHKDCKNIDALRVYNMAKTIDIDNDICKYKLDYEFSIIAFYQGIKNIEDIFINIMNKCPDTSIISSVLNNYKFYISNLHPHKSVNLSSTLILKNKSFVSSSLSIILYNYGYLANQRFVNYTYNKETLQIKYERPNMTVNKLIILDKQFNVISSKMYDVNNKCGVRNIGIEDIRLYKYNDQLLFNGVGEHVDGKIGIKTGIYDVNESVLQYTDIKPPYNSNCEKNWVYIDGLNMVYKWYPLQIGNIIDNKLVITKEKSMPSLFKYVRGSTNSFEYMDELWFVCHIVSPDKNYYHLIVIFDKEMNLVRYSNPFKFMGERIEYCIGLIVETDIIVMTYSVWDCSSYISTYTHNTLPSFTLV